MLRVHSQGRGPSTSEGRELLSPEVLRGYIARAKEVETYVPEDLTGACWQGFDLRCVLCDCSSCSGLLCLREAGAASL